MPRMHGLSAGCPGLGPAQLAAAEVALATRPRAEPACSALTVHAVCRHQVEVPITCWAGRLWARVSAQIYNELAEFEQLAEAVCRLRGHAQANGH